MKGRNLWIGLFVAFVFIFVSGTFYVWQIFYNPNFLIQKQDTFLYIPKEAKFPEVLDSLKKNRIIDDQLSFAFLAKASGYQEEVKPGAYLIKANSTNLEVLRQLKGGHQTPIKLTFQSLRTREDVLRTIARKYAFTEEELDQALRKVASEPDLALDEQSDFIILMPNTYEFYWTVEPEKFVRTMKGFYNKFWNTERLEKAKKLGLSPREVVTLASIVICESKKADEQSTIAGVYLNRLKTNMLLQADPTVIFAHQDFSIKRVNSRLTALDSPYNTYKYKGLPPGPIYLPEGPVIDRTLNAQNHNYLYFCARADLSGYHDFAADYADHRKNAAAYQAAISKLGIN